MRIENEEEHDDAAEDVVELTDVERDLLLAALNDENAKPNAALIRAAELSKTLIDREPYNGE